MYTDLQSWIIWSKTFIATQITDDANLQIVGLSLSLDLMMPSGKPPLDSKL